MAQLTFSQKKALVLRKRTAEKKHFIRVVEVSDRGNPYVTSRRDRGQLGGWGYEHSTDLFINYDGLCAGDLFKKSIWDCLERVLVEINH